jgi:hypothetical protein
MFYFFIITKNNYKQLRIQGSCVLPQNLMHKAPTAPASRRPIL